MFLLFRLRSSIWHQRMSWCQCQSTWTANNASIHFPAFNQQLVSLVFSFRSVSFSSGSRCPGTTTDNGGALDLPAVRTHHGISSEAAQGREFVRQLWYVVPANGWSSWQSRPGQLSVTQLLAGPTFCTSYLLLQSKLLLISWLKSLGNKLWGAPYLANFIQVENPHILSVFGCISVLFNLNSLLI